MNSVWLGCSQDRYSAGPFAQPTKLWLMKASKGVS